MSQDNAYRMLIGPYGLHALLASLLGLLVLFLFVFNFTDFF